MSNEIYNAFVEAGLAKEANRLSVAKPALYEGRSRIIPTIRHYIALADGINERSALACEGASQYSCIPLWAAARSMAIEEITEYITKLLQTEKDTQKLEKIRGLANKLGMKFQTKINSGLKIPIPIVEIK